MMMNVGSRSGNKSDYLSLHYASTPALSSTNSVEENSVNSDEFEVSSSSDNSSQQGYYAANNKNNHNNTLSICTSGYASSIASNASHYQRSSLNSEPPCDPLKTRIAVQNVATVSTRKIHRPKSLYHLNHEFNATTASSSSSPVPLLHQHLQHVTTVRVNQQEPVTTTPTSLSSVTQDKLTVTESDLRAIDTCYRGHKTRVFVCTSLANLYSSHRSRGDWQLKYTGIPVLILDTGTARSRVRKQITLLMVEKGTCFTLWRDVIDNLSQYSCQDEMFHVLKWSTDHSVQIGLSFDSAEAAQKFHSCLLMLTSDPANISLSGPSGLDKKFQKMLEKEEKLKRKMSKNYSPPSKSEISRPCGFQHVVSVGHQDVEKYFSMQAFVPQKWSGAQALPHHVRREQPGQQQPDQPQVGSQKSQMQEITDKVTRLSVFQSCDELNI